MDKGDILIDGISTQQIPRSEVRKAVCDGTSRYLDLEGSIKENIVFNQENISDEEVVEACRTVGLDHFINTLPKGYDTVLSEKDSLSDGQKEMITIARAIVTLQF